MVRRTAFDLALAGGVALAVGALCAGGCAAGGESAAEGAILEASSSGSGTDRWVLDVREDGAQLAGRLEPARPDSDPDRVVVLTRLPGAEDRVLDARFVPGGIVTLGADHVLRLRPDQGEPVVLDDEVYPPLSVEAGFVAYVRGAPPDLSLARVTSSTGEVERLAPGHPTVWSPALSTDGSEVLFASSVDGSLRLFVVAPNGSVRALPASARVPSAPTAPRWSGGTLVFEDEGGVAVLDVESGQVTESAPGAHGIAALLGVVARTGAMRSPR